MSQMDQDEIIFLQQPDYITNPVTYKIEGLAWTYSPKYGSVKLVDDEYNSVIRAIEQRFDKTISDLSMYKIKYSTAANQNYERELSKILREEWQPICDKAFIEAYNEFIMKL